MPLPGGAADKLGNRYERLWTVLGLVSVMEERADSIWLEPPGSEGEGIEFRVAIGSSIRYHQVKRQNSRLGHWTAAELEREGVLSAFGRRLQDSDVECVFVSTQSVSHLEELSGRARAASSTHEFLADFLTSHSLLKELDGLRKTWGCGDEECFRRLRCIRFEVTSEAVLVGWVETRLSALVDADPESARLILSELCDISIHRQLTADDIWRFLETRELHSRDWSQSKIVVVAVNTTAARYCNELEGSLIGRCFIEREEVSQILDAVSSSVNNGAFVIGEAGTGKSSVLCHVVRRLNERGTPVLALRLDRLHPTQLPDDVGRQLGLPGSPASVLSAVAQGRRCVLVVDQLDAVSVASGRNPSFLGCIDEIIRQADAFPNMAVVVACRSWDVDNDRRLRRLASERPGLKEIRIGALSRKSVVSVLEQLGLGPSSMSDSQIELLRIPLHLSLFSEIARTSGSPPTSFRGVNDLYGAFWDAIQDALRAKLGCPPRWTDVVDTLCDYMSDRQVLSCHVSVVDEHQADARAMASERVLVQDGDHYSFFHEGFFDYCFARRFSARGRSVFDFFAQSRQELFRRAQLRQVLAHLRAQDPFSYIHGLEQLLKSDSIRFHLKKVTLGFLQLVDEPTEPEWSVLESLLGDSRYRREVLRVLTKPQWFRYRGCIGVLEDWLASRESGLIAEALWVMRIAQKNNGDLVAELLEPYANQTEWIDSFVGFMQWAELGCSRRLFDLFLNLLDHGILDGIRGPIASNSDFWSLLYGLHSEKPSWTAEVIGHYLQRGVARAGECGVTNPFERACGTIATDSTIEVFMEPAHRDPEAFITHILPPMLAIIKLAATERDHELWTDRVWSFWVVGPGHEARDHLLHSMIGAMGVLAESLPESFARLFDQLKDAPYYTVQFLMLHGLAANPHRFAGLAVDYICEEPKRLRLGYSDSPYWSSRELVARVSPVCSDSDLRRLEQTILDYYPRWERSRNGRKSFGRAQMTILEGIDPSRRSERVTRRLAELHRKFGSDSVTEPRSIEATFVPSPIDEDEATKMTDAQWLRAFAAYPSDRLESDNVGALVGGRDELARVLQAQASKAPQRFASLALRMSDHVAPEYYHAIVNGVAQAEIQVDTGMAVDLCMRCHRLPGRPCGIELAGLVERVGSLELPQELFSMISWYATQDPDPKSDLWRVHSEGSSPLYGGDALTAGINSARGRAHEAIARLIFADSSRGEAFVPLLSATVLDSCISVRAVVAFALLALLNADRNAAVNLLQRLCMTDDVLLGTAHVVRFIWHASQTHYRSLESVVGRMVASKDAAVAQAGGILSASLALRLPEVQELAQSCVTGTEPVRLGVAEALAQNVELALENETWVTNLQMLFNDSSSEVRKRAATVFRGTRVAGAIGAEELISAFVESAAFAENPEAIVLSLERSTEVLPKCTPRLVRRFLEVCGDEAGDIRTKASFSAYHISKLVLRYYAQSEGARQQECLDLIDLLLERDALGIADQVKVLDRGT